MAIGVASAAVAAPYSASLARLVDRRSTLGASLALGVDVVVAGAVAVAADAGIADRRRSRGRASVFCPVKPGVFVAAIASVRDAAVGRGRDSVRPAVA